MFKKKWVLFSLTGFLLFNFSPSYAQPLEKLLGYAFPGNLCASPSTGQIAWTFNINGLRNIYLSTDKGHTFKKLTNFKKDDGQSISNLEFSPDGKRVIYIRGGEPDGNWSSGVAVNPTSSPVKPSVSLWSHNLSDNKPGLLVRDNFSSPAISPDSKEVAFIRDGQVWLVPIDGSKKAKKLFYARGRLGSVQWSPNGDKIAFVSNRGKHSFVGIYTDKNTPIKWIDPSFANDASPHWSPDGEAIVFVRRPAGGGAPDSILARHIRPWELRVAPVNGEGSVQIWKSPPTLNGSVPTTSGRYNLHWAGNGRIVFLNTQDNWPHLYSIKPDGSQLLLLTPGNFMVEYVQLSPDKKELIFSANTGSDKLDIDRRHIGIVSVDKADMKMITEGEGIEALPVFAGNKTVAFISSTAFRPPLPAVMSIVNNDTKLIGKALVSSHYTAKELVKPTQVIFNAPDGTPIHGQLFENEDGAKNKPAILCVHGGPMRQMLLGWSYSSYYAAHYAVNQVLADLGYVVLSVNYRLGIGYGNEFHHPANAGREGASEYQDILAAGQWLAKQPNVDSKRIGIYGGSYGGLLAAQALGNNSNLFAAGVDIHGVHSRLPNNRYTTDYEQAPDAELADEVAWEISPISHVDTWSSPVLLIHGDDDRNVDFDQTVNLLKRLDDKGVYYEAMVLPDETHHLLKHSNLVKVYKATIDFFERMLKK